MSSATKTAPLLPTTMIALAAGEIGVSEVNGTNCGPRVDQYKAATWLDPKKGWPWCAAFICWLVLESLKATGVKETKTFKRPRTASAYDFRNWSLAQDDSTHTRDRPGRDIQPGDIVAYQSISHIGIAVTAPDKNGNFLTIEGNTDGAGSREGGAVLRKRRNSSNVRFRIRLKV